jgi:hypothetical protein
MKYFHPSANFMLFCLAAFEMETWDPLRMEQFFLREAASPRDLLERLSKASSTLQVPSPALHAKLIEVGSYFPPQLQK